MLRSRFVVVVLLLSLRGADGRGARRARRKERAQAQNERAQADEVKAALASGETIDPLGYYRYRWSPPTDSCGTELHADYDGTRAWNWGLDKSQHVATAADCCAKCKAHASCNSWVFCPEPVCFAPDAHRHTFGECWMKNQRDPASPSVNMRGRYTAKYRARPGHHHAPPMVHWISGTIRVTRNSTNGTWSGRAVW